MARIEKKDNKTSLVLNEEESRQLAGIEGELELFQPKKGVLLLIEKHVLQATTGAKQAEPTAASPKQTEPVPTPAVSKPNPIDEKLFKILDDRKMLSQRIEGKFEKNLASGEFRRFQELLKEGIIEKFKLNESYKKPVYRLNDKKFREWRERQKSQSIPVSQPGSGAPQKTGSGFSSLFSLEKDDFTILKNDEEARRISSERQEDFKKGLLRGIKGFDGRSFIFKKSVLETMQSKILEFLEKNKKADLQSISKSLQLHPEAVRGACEFLKEDGQIFEKTKQQYCLV